MTAVSTPVNPTIARPSVARSAFIAIAMVVILAALAFVVINALTGPSHPTAGYDAPFYSPFLQEMAASW